MESEYHKYIQMAQMLIYWLLLVLLRSRSRNRKQMEVEGCQSVFWKTWTREQTTSIPNQHSVRRGTIETPEAGNRKTVCDPAMANIPQRSTVLAKAEQRLLQRN